MSDERALHLDGRDPVRAHVHDVIDPSQQPVITVLIDPGSITGEVDVLVLTPVGLDVAIVVPENAPQHGWPGGLEDEVPTTARSDFPTLLVVDGRRDGRERLGR